MDRQMNSFPLKGNIDPSAFATGPVRPMMGPGGPMMNARPGMGPIPAQYMNMGPRPTMMHPNSFQTNGAQPPGMMNNESREEEESPEPEKLKKIKVDLSDKERGFYSNLISKIEPDGSGRINGKQAVSFFKTSGVNVNTLKSIWKTCARTNVESLSRDEFYLALKLIAYAQNGIPPTEDSVLAKIEVPFPQFKSDSGKAPMGAGMPPPAVPQRGPTLADHLPDMNQLNMVALNNSSGNSLIPGMDEHMKQREVEKATEKMMSNTNSPWFLRPEDVQKYNSIFEYFNKSQTGVLSIEEAKEAFMQTQLDDDVLEQIWSMIDTEESGEFDRKMFCMAMHILYKVKLGAKCPPTLPHVIKACVTSYFADGVRPQIATAPPNMQMNKPMNQNMPQNISQNRPTNQGNMGGIMNENIMKAEEDPFASEMRPQSRPDNSMLSIDNQPNMGSSMPKQPNNQIYGMNNDMNMSKGGGPNMADNRRMDQFSSTHGSSTSVQGSMSGQNEMTKMMEQTIKEQERMVQSRKEDISALNTMHSNNNQLLSSLREKSARLRNELDRLNNEYKNVFSKVAKQNEEIKSEVENINNMTNSIANTMSNMQNSSKSSSFNMGNGGMGAPPPKQFNLQNIHVVKPAGSGEGVFPGGMGMMNQNTQRSNDAGMNSQRQSRQNPNASGGFPTNDYSTAVPSNMNTPNKNMNKQMRPQSTDPHRMNNIQAHNFGMMNSQMRSNDDNFFGNSGMKGNPAPSMNNDNEDFDWGM